jgi:hypothetical protein
MKNENGILRWAQVIVLAHIMSLQGLAVERATPLRTFATLPVKEITVFKDGHAFVAHEGELPTDTNGNVLMDYLPTPVTGTFWPYSGDKSAKLTSVVASSRRVLVEHTALTLRELLEANLGAQAIISEGGTNRYEATILDLPSRSSEEFAATSPPNTPERLPEKGNLVLLKTADGEKVLSLDHIQDVIFKESPKTSTVCEEFRNLLNLKLDWGTAKPAASARVGLFYLQKGFRWIPNYKIEIDGKGNASVKLQATLINELTDLDDVSVNLVIGVPTFAFKDTVDPMALQQNLAQLSQYFQTGNPARNSPLAYNFSNAIMSQSARSSDFGAGAAPEAAVALGPELGETTKTEDLFMFNVQHVTLKRGERMVLSVAEFSLPYKDVFTLDLPFAPPPEVRGNLNTEQQRELARLFNAPKVLHKIRLTNSSRYPVTTAPALLLREGRLLAQGMTTYASVGSSLDLTITTAVDFQVTKSEHETKRTPDAVRENGNAYTRIDLSGTITLTSHHSLPAEIEVTRSVLGNGDQADHDAKIQKLSLFDNEDSLSANDNPYWWNWYGWPYWWSSFNGLGRLTWKIKLEPGRHADLAYDWHYFWR